MNYEGLFKWLILSILVLFAIAIATFLWTERDYLFGTGGIAESGSKFDVSVGSSLTTATETLENNKFELVKYALTLNEQPCPSPPKTSNPQISVFSDRSWRRRSVCVASEDGVVVYIAWTVGLFDP